MVVYDIETFYTIKFVLFLNCIYKLGEIPGKPYRHITQTEIEKCKNDCIVFKSTDCINEMLDHVLNFEGKPKKIRKKIVQYELCSIGDNGNGFASCIVLNNLPQWRTVVNLVGNGVDFVSLNKFNGYVEKNRMNPHSVRFGCGRFHIFNLLKKIGISYRLQLFWLKQEIDHDEIDEVT